jgi:hypothetical protein
MIIFFVVTVVLSTISFIYYKGNHRKLDNNITIDNNSYWIKNG